MSPNKKEESLLPPAPPKEFGILYIVGDEVEILGSNGNPLKPGQLASSYKTDGTSSEGIRDEDIRPLPSSSVMKTNKAIITKIGKKDWVVVQYEDENGTVGKLAFRKSSIRLK